MISHSIILSSGDACHLMIPVGGFGMNTGVLDAYDLGWKLVATLKGWGGEKLLASYTVCTLKQSSQCSKSYREFVLAVHKTAMANTSSINTITSDLLLWYTDGPIHYIAYTAQFNRARGSRIRCATIGNLSCKTATRRRRLVIQ